MASDNPQLTVCFLCLEAIAPNKKATSLDFVSLPEKFLVFTEGLLEIPSREWALVDVVKLKNTFCLKCSTFVSVICSLYENMCDIQTKLADKMGQLSNLLEGSKERIARRKGKALMEILERQLGPNGNDVKKVEKMRELLGDKCKVCLQSLLYSKKRSPKNSPNSFSSGGYSIGNISEAGDSDNDSVDVKIENSSLNGSDGEDNDLQNYSNEFFKGDIHKMDEQGEDNSASVSSPSPSDDDDNSLDEDEDDLDLSLEKGTPAKNYPSEQDSLSCRMCGKQLSCKSSIYTHMKNIHGIIASKPEKPFSCTVVIQY